MLYVFGLILLWFRPEYKFALFFAFFLPILDFALFVLFGGAAILTNPSLSTLAATSDEFVIFLRAHLPTILVFLGFAFPIVFLRKWMKSRTSGDERRAEALVAQVRAEEEAQRRAGGA